MGFAGLSGPLSSVDEGGFASASFHSFEDTLAWDAYSGDYGPNFVGHALEMGAYLVKDDRFGWQAFGGNVVSGSTEDSVVRVQARDSLRRRVFIAPIGAWLSLDAGAFDEFTFDPTTNAVTLSIAASAPGISAAAPAPQARLVVQNTADNGLGVLIPTANLTMDAGAYVIPFKDGTASVALSL